MFQKPHSGSSVENGFDGIKLDRGQKTTAEAILTVKSS